jgi:hypothetical protein
MPNEPDGLRRSFGSGCRIEFVVAGDAIAEDVHKRFSIAGCVPSYRPEADPFGFSS